MRIHVYEPLLQAVQTDDGRTHPVPAPVLESARFGSEVDTVRRWAKHEGLIARGDHLGVFQTA